MPKVTVIIPSRGEKQENLSRTVNSIFQNFTGNYDIIIGFNGTPYTQIPSHPKIKFHFEKENIGLKPMINKLAELATGDYIYKSDAHCAFGYGFDEILLRDMEDDWLVTPRFKIIKNDWSIQMRDGKEEYYDYFYLCCPFTDKRGLRFKAGGHWPERTLERLESHPDVDETPQIHGSGWFVKRNYYLKKLRFPDIDPFGHAQEPIWLALKNWIIGGKVMVNKNTWYAHLHQDSKDRGYSENKEETEKTYNLTADYWLKQPGFGEFVQKFMPMPTWPPNWGLLLSNYIHEHS